MDQIRKTCIEACAECATACEFCVGEHIGDKEMAECLRLCIDCADFCAVDMRLLARNSRSSPALCGLCADACDAYATECDRFDSRRCTEACRKCAGACRQLAA